MARQLLVHDVRVAVVHAGPEHRVGALQDRAEGHLGARREVPHGADVARDVLLKSPRSPIQMLLYRTLLVATYRYNIVESYTTCIYM